MISFARLEKGRTMAEFCIHEKHGGMCEKTDTYCNLGACPYEDLKEYAPVKHGKWVLGNVEPGYFTPGGNRPWICSDCGWLASYMLGKPNERYCPNCGAKMDGECDEE